MRFEEYREYDATGLAKQVAEGSVTAAELVDLALQRSRQVNASINAVVAECEARGRQRADSVDGSEPFAGVPMLIKDLGTHIKGLPTTQGSRLLRNAIADHDSELTTRFERLGCSLLGKTNTPELGLTITTESQLHGPVRNPWNPKITAGGSSGGAAAAVAAGIVPMAHASDGGGSIRAPAACCGLVGLKPSRARLPIGPDIGEAWSGMVCHHVLTRSVRDCAAVLQHCQGEDLGAPYCGPARQAFLDALEAPSQPLKIALYTEAPNQCAVDPQVVQAVEDSAKLCEQLGHQVIEQTPQINASGFTRAFNVIMATNTLLELNQASEAVGRPWDDSNVEAVTRHVAEMGKGFSAADYVESLQIMHRVGREMAIYMQQVDVLISPRVGHAAIPLRPSQY